VAGKAGCLCITSTLCSVFHCIILFCSLFRGLVSDSTSALPLTSHRLPHWSRCNVPSRSPLPGLNRDFEIISFVFLTPHNPLHPSRTHALPSIKIRGLTDPASTDSIPPLDLKETPFSPTSPTAPDRHHQRRIKARPGPKDIHTTAT
jgi:hypothetical protein